MGQKTTYKAAWLAVPLTEKYTFIVPSPRMLGHFPPLEEHEGAWSYSLATCDIDGSFAWFDTPRDAYLAGKLDLKHTDFVVGKFVQRGDRYRCITVFVFEDGRNPQEYGEDNPEYGKCIRGINRSYLIDAKEVTDV